MNGKLVQFLTKEKNIYGILVWVLILGKIVNLSKYGFQYTGSDDLVFWVSGFDYSQGIFHEPYFYGQNYNFALEALLAVPFLWGGVPVYFALPIVSTFIGVFPFLMFAHVLFKKGFYIPAYVFLLIPISLPVEYDLITSMSRGFVTGLFFCSFLIHPILEPKKTRSFVILGASISLAYLLNPNSLILSFPVSLFMLFHNYKNWKFYVVPLSIAIPVFSIQEFAKLFYEINPDYKVHFMWDLEYNSQLLIDAFSNLNQLFRYLTPIFWTGHWVIVLVILILGFAQLKKDWKQGLSIILAMVFALVLMGVNKINDDIGKIFLSSTRMYLAIPLVLGLALFWYKTEFKYPKRWKIGIMTIAILFFSIKIIILPDVVQQHTNINNYGPVGIKKLSDLEKECSKLSETTQKFNVDLVVFIPRTHDVLPRVEFYNLGCDFLLDTMVPGVMNIYERRTWIYLEERQKARETVMLYNCTLKNVAQLKNEMNIEIINTFPDIVLVRNNDKTLSELCEAFGIKCQRNGYY